MKKQLKKTLALAMTMAMAGTLLAGCGGGTSSASTDTGSAATDGGASASGGYTDYSEGFPNQVTIQIPVYDRGFEGWNPADNYYTRWVQSEFGDKYNVKVEYISVGRNTEVQDFTQMIGAHKAPDIIFHYDMPAAVDYYSQGAMQDIDYDELAFYAPTYWANMEETIKTYGTLDGHQAFLFAGRDAIYYNWVTLIRKDWCDAVNKDIPTTWDEFVEVAEAWKEAGLGTIGDMLHTTSFTFEYQWIDPSAPAEELALYLDLNVAPLTWSATETYLREYNALYNAGIYDPEFYLTTEDSQWKGKFVAGQVGTYSFYIASSTDVFSSLLANDPDAEIAILPDVVAEGFKPYYYEYPSYGMIMGISVDSTAEERAAVYMFLDWMSQPENLFYLQHGVEGETYTLDENGLAVQDSEYEGEYALSNNNNKDYWCLVQEVMTYGDEALDLTANKTSLAPAGYEDFIQQQYEICKAKEDCGLVTPIFTKSLSSTGDYSADLKILWQEACTACITCSPEDFDENYAKYCEEYLEAGYQEILDEKQKLIDEGSVLIVE